MEKWKPIIDWEELYEVSDLGNIRSKIREGKTQFGKRAYGGKIVKPFVSSSGYLAVNLTSNNRRKQCHVHRLVLETFMGKPEKGMECCHADGTRTNSHLNNLRWDCRKNNHADKKIHGTWQGGENNGYAKLTEEQAIFIKYSKETLQKLAKKYNVSVGCVEKVRYGSAWKHI